MVGKKIAANRSWFNFTVKSSDQQFGPLAVYAFSGKEEVHAPYEFTVELVSRNKSLDLTALLGKEALLSIADRSGEKRLVHGVVRQTEQLHTANSFTHYRCVVVPRLWFLSLTQDHRIYQNLSVPEIIETVLGKHHFTGESYAFQLQGQYQPREYCVQYGESDLHFISRLCEEEGIYYYFEHKEDAHKLCFSDAAGGPSIPGEHSLRYFQGSGQQADTSVISRLRVLEKVNSDQSTYREWNFTTPKIDLGVQKKEADAKKAPVPVAMYLETYRFPHLYQDKGEGERYAAIQLDRQLTFRTWIEAEADVSRFIPGFTFTMHSHPRDEANRSWWVYAVYHEGEQPEVLEHEAPDDRGLVYIAKLKAIPGDVRYLPALSHPKVRIEGLQSAVVTGPPSEEVFPDEYGRVKVKFHWDRSGCNNENTTCWIRVADAWAGVNFGFIQIPRVGQEVMVEFMEGDPDRPVITGRVYNASLMPPWTLPEQKTLSGIQSREFKADRKNQLIMDDTQGQIQAQLSSDHGLSQLNLGYLTRINHVEGRKDFRGEGFELRTDDWGAIRAAKGLYVTTDTRKKAQNHQKDLKEAAEKLLHSSDQHERTAKLAEAHKAQDASPDVAAVTKSLHDMTDEVRGGGDMHGELTKPHLVFSSPAGMAVTTPNTVHIHTGENTAFSTGRHFSVSTAQSLLVSAMEKVSLFAYKLGMRLFAARGKVEIQAQSDALDIIAEKVIRIISAKESVNITAAKEIMLTGGGSYICINAKGIEHGTNGSWKVHAANREMAGPKSKNPKLPSLPKSGAAAASAGAATAAAAVGRAGAPSGGEAPDLTTAAGSVTKGFTSGTVPFDPEKPRYWGHLPINCKDEPLTPGDGPFSSPKSEVFARARDRGELLEGKRPLRPGETPPSEKALEEWRGMRDEVEGKETLEGKAQMAEYLVNKNVNYRLEPPGADVWAMPDETLDSMTGDCEDYALLKYALLEQSGVDPQKMAVIGLLDPNNPLPGGKPSGHAVLTVIDDTKDKASLLILDNMKSKTVQGDLGVYNSEYDPQFLLRPGKRCGMAQVLKEAPQ